MLVYYITLDCIILKLLNTQIGKLKYKSIKDQICVQAPFFLLFDHANQDAVSENFSKKDFKKLCCQRHHLIQ